MERFTLADALNAAATHAHFLVAGNEEVLQEYLRCYNLTLGKDRLVRDDEGIPVAEFMGFTGQGDVSFKLLSQLQYISVRCEVTI